jgi:hypothetical protein
VTQRLFVRIDGEAFTLSHSAADSKSMRLSRAWDNPPVLIV